ncbi:YbaB/EbfC family nucleoid-associated protein [Nocardioides allogilvus]|uniref:YbaB/EbfC family nucleoid-associated protein n=1 Tax=Nocardioides allogilvus TaxID=2072017 RepID=UPI000D320B0F|nr:YbaB/EbfC family nucleoid-associated protein [Nocardioides allogilvus]
MTQTPPSEPWLDDLRRETARHLEQIAQVQDELSTLYGEAHAAEGRVRVRVNAAGRPTVLTLEPSALALPPSDLAAAILRAVDDATARAGERLAELVGTLVPAADLDAMLAGRPTDADRVAVRAELDALSADGG